MRIASCSGLRPEQLAILIDNRAGAATGRRDPTGHYLALGHLAAGAKVQVHFPLDERVSGDRFAGHRYRILWRGNYVVQWEPREAKISLFLTVSE